MTYSMKIGRNVYFTKDVEPTEDPGFYTALVWSTNTGQWIRTKVAQGWLDLCEAVGELNG